jgi:hypothetical protein
VVGCFGGLDRPWVLSDSLAATGIERPALRTPRSAAFAGIAFAVLACGSLVAIHFAIPHKPAGSGLAESPKRDLLLVGLSLLPFAAVAFLWFIGVVRDRVGEREDRFFGTVFLGSGLLFVGVLLVGEAVASGMVLSVTSTTQTFGTTAPDWWIATRNVGTELVEAALQMAGVFLTATTTLLWRTGAAPRWLTLSGTVISALLLFSIYLTQWIGLLFPLWILVLSVYVLIAIRKPDTPNLI